MANVSENRSLVRHSMWRLFLLRLAPSPAAYRPERHYMRGPGPKYRENHSAAAIDPAVPRPSENFLQSSTMWP
jgi:hypothetical protein